MRKSIAVLIIIALVHSYVQPIYASTLVPEFLCEIGLKLYKEGNIPEALSELNKALLLNPTYAPAREYIRLIQEQLAREQGVQIEKALKAKPVKRPTLKAVARPAVKPVVKPLPKPAVKPAAKPALVPAQPVPAVSQPVVTPVVAPSPKPEVAQFIPVVAPPSTPVLAQVTPPVAAPAPIAIQPTTPTRVTPAAAIKQPAPALSVPPSAVAPPPAALTPAPVAVAPKAEPLISDIAQETAMEKAMKQLERQAAPVISPAPVLTPPAVPGPAVVSAPAIPLGEKEEVEIKEVAVPSIITLDASVRALTSAIEIEQGRSFIIKGENIQRFLVTSPSALDVHQQSSSELLATARDFGYTYLHVWDDQGRWTVEFLTVPVKPKGPTYEELMRKAEERVGTFKLRYSMDWSSYESGRRIDSLERTSYSYGHYLTLTGPTPYGDIDSSASVRKLQENTDLTYFTLGLTNGKIGPFEGFSLRGADLSPPITNLQFSAPTLRGVMLQSPAFDKTVSYTLFWGREGGGKYGSLSPGLNKTKHSFLSGMNINYYLNKDQTYGFSMFRGWGTDRPDTLHEYGYDSYADWKIKDWDLRYEIAHDTENLAQLLTATYKIPKLQLVTEIRNTDKDYMTMTGSGWRVGELGSLFTLSYKPTEYFDILSSLDIFKDRLYPNPEDTSRWNQDFRTDASLRFSDLTSLRADYSFQNELGRIAPYRSQNVGLGLYHTFEWPRRISTYLIARHQENEHFSSHNLDYNDEKITAGMRFNLLKDLYYFINEEYNWLSERYTGERSNPQAMETGLDWSSQIPRTQLYASARLLYRDEQETDSALSFFSGEDYLEGYGTLSYRPSPDMEWYCSTRVRNVWAENTGVSKHIDADFNAGFRYLWDTGLRWEPIGAIDGYVFRDMNSDALRQNDEGPVEGIKLWLGKRSTQTDSRGYYKFDKIRARRAYINLDTQTLPSGFVLTVPVTQEASIANHKSVHLDFGVIMRSEIWGLVFVDVDGDNKFSIEAGDKGIKGVLLELENGMKAFTDGNGQYRFPHVSAEEHTITLDLNTLPVEYLPIVPLKKTAVVFEGVSYNYNIPVRSSK